MNKNIGLLACSIILLFPTIYCFAQDQGNSAGGIVTAFDQKPQFPGGEQQMFYFISKTIQYPEKALEKEKEGTVYVSCMIDTDGTIRNPIVTKGIKNGCDEEAISVINKMPRWIPGKQSGARVKAAYVIPVEFKINTAENLRREGNRKSYDLYGHGVELIKEKKYYEAMRSFDMEIASNETGYNAYYNRGVSKLLMTDTAEACRDWALAAYYGDNEVAEQLDNLCNGLAIIDEDTFKSEAFKKKPDAFPVKNDDSIADGEVMPVFPGGINAMLSFLSHNIRYPVSARAHNVTGKVYIKYYVSKTGKVKRPYILRGIGGGCDEEALRVIKLMPDWKPGSVFGRPVPVLFNQPVGFMLK